MLTKIAYNKFCKKKQKKTLPLLLAVLGGDGSDGNVCDVVKLMLMVFFRGDSSDCYCFGLFRSQVKMHVFGF